MGRPASPTISAESYQRMADEALRGFLRPALTHVRKRDGGAAASIRLTVRTSAPGVRLPPGMVARHPETVVIALHERSPPLSINRRAITLGVVFDGKWSKAVILFAAIQRFADQDAGFVLDLAPEEEPTLAETPEPTVIDFAAYARRRA